MRDIETRVRIDHGILANIVSEHREPFDGGAGDAAGPNSSATYPASVRTAVPGIKQMLYEYGHFY